MMSSTLGAPLGGTMRGGHQVFEFLALSLITPPNFGGGGGSCFPSIVVVALGEPNSPVTCCAEAALPSERKLEATKAPHASFRAFAPRSIFSSVEKFWLVSRGTLPSRNLSALLAFGN